MEGKWQIGPNYRTWLKYLNPLRWSTRTVKVITAAFFAIILPIYLYIGFQPASSLNYEGYPLLIIPSINLSTPVAKVELSGRELITPETIAGIYSTNPNKLFIFGHSSTVFKHLDEANIDETFIYNDRTYRIISAVTLEKSAIDMSEVLAATPEETIVIMTCAGDPLPNQDATHRLIITATLSE